VVCPCLFIGITNKGSAWGVKGKLGRIVEVPGGFVTWEEIGNGLL
jgi:hypothetical protein